MELSRKGAVLPCVYTGPQIGQWEHLEWLKFVYPGTCNQIPAVQLVLQGLQLAQIPNYEMLSQGYRELTDCMSQRQFE